MSVCIHVHMVTYEYNIIYICIMSMFVYVTVCVCVCVCVCACVHVHVHVYAYVYVYAYLYVSVCVWMFHKVGGPANGLYPFSKFLFDAAPSKTGSLRRSLGLPSFFDQGHLSLGLRSGLPQDT